MHRRVNFFLPDQYGYAAGYPYYTKYLLQNGYEVSVYCADLGEKKIPADTGVLIHYLPLSDETNTLKRMLRLNSYFIKVLKASQQGEISIVKYYPLCSYLALACRRAKLLLDVRTGAISGSVCRNALMDALLRLEASYFSKGFVLSDLMRSALKLSIANYSLLPLGADVLSNSPKNYCASMSLLYVGALNYRHIYKTIEGLALARPRIGRAVSYDIVGYGSDEECERLLNTIEAHQLQDMIHYHGRLSHEEMRPLFDRANVGVVFVPQAAMYNHQPSTKMFEYALSGLFLLATDTAANRELATPANCILHQDSPEGFADALLRYISFSDKIDEEEVRSSLMTYSWRTVVERDMIPRLEL